jgi:hypothetical protein
MCLGPAHAIIQVNIGRVAELADAGDLKSPARKGRAGSNPALAIERKLAIRGFRYCLPNKAPYYK